MNRVLMAVSVATLFCRILAAQSPQSPTEVQAAPPAASAPSAPAEAAQRIAAGSVLPVELAKTVDAKKAKTGDEVVAKVTEDLRSNTGIVIVPKDTKVIGHVTEAQPRTKQQAESELAITFDHVVLKDGEPMPMPMSIQAVIAPPNRNLPATPAAAPAEPGPMSGGTRPASPGAGSPAPTMPQASGSAPTEAPVQQQAPPQITGETRGVVGIAHLNLSAATDPTRGSLLTSDKNNVKLDNGTLMLLRVDR